MTIRPAQSFDAQNIAEILYSLEEHPISYQRGFYAKHGFQEKPNSARFILNIQENL